MTIKQLRLGTRGSKLAMWQSNWAKTELEKRGHSVELIVIKTDGDVHSGSLANIGMQGLFTKRLQIALLDNEIDFAVHSLKDLPTDTNSDLSIAAVPRREDPRDVFVCKEYGSLAELPPCATIGTGSIRRSAQLLHLRQDVKIENIRGNVDTRISKLESGEYDAVVLARAGLLRLGLEDHISQVFDKSELMPAVGQGALAIETRSNDAFTRDAICELNDNNSYWAVIAEREMLRNLRGGCLAPIGAWSSVDEHTLALEGVVLSSDGKEKISATASGPLSDADTIGRQVASDLTASGAGKFLESL